jgi:G:T-mismatch repair DNA endonuclease (very short patch repair protein)
MAKTYSHTNYLTKPSKQKLIDLYEVQRLSGREIARVLQLPIPTIFSWMQKFGIQFRSRREACHLYYVKHPEEFQKRSQRATAALTGKTQSPVHIANRMAGRHEAAKIRGYYHSPETRRKMSQGGRGHHVWTSEQRERLLPIFMKNRQKRPTAPERRFQELVTKYKLPYKYVGDGYTWIVGRCPDFLNVNGQKIVVEIFGHWWHNTTINKLVRPEYTLEATKSHYAKYGFNCIVIWEEELEDDKTVLAKLGEKSK